MIRVRNLLYCKPTAGLGERTRQQEEHWKRAPHTVFIEEELRRGISLSSHWSLAAYCPRTLTPTAELVIWGMRVYAYSLIAHIRHGCSEGSYSLLKPETHRRSSCVGRHIYEWNMQSSYAYVTFTVAFRWTATWEARGSYTSTICDGNGWIKRHASDKYAPEMPNDEH